MRLINTSNYKLEEHLESKSYAILSHTWRDNEEVLYKEFSDGHDKGATKNGFRKIKYLCTQALKDGCNYAWLDTACIDKSSSAELSEAINSMFAWYQEAKICYVYLDDVDQVSDISASRWITRGWTLQELLAPADVRFYNRDWTCIGTKSTLAEDLALWTRIDQIALMDATTIPQHSAATRMLWASSRRTTRIEDMAYCLLGIFGVNMPLLYGERHRAFRRLQEQILRQDRDVTLLAFDRKSDRTETPELLAQSPDVFGKRPKLVDQALSTPYCELTSHNLRSKLRVFRTTDWNRFGSGCFLLLECRYEFDLDHMIAIPVTPGASQGNSTVEGQYLLARPVQTIPRNLCKDLEREDVLILHGNYGLYQAPKLLAYARSRYICTLKIDQLRHHGYKVLYAIPAGGANSWDSHRLVSEVVSPALTLIRRFVLFHQDHDEAFTFMFAVHRKITDTRLVQAWCNFEAKPKTIDCANWLQQYGPDDVLPQPSKKSEWYTNVATGMDDNVAEIDGVKWRFLCEVERLFTRKIPLVVSSTFQSEGCFPHIELRTTYESFSNGGRWTIDLKPIIS